MPNVIAQDKCSFTYLEFADTLAKLQAIAKDRHLDGIALLVREATAAYCNSTESHSAKRRTEKIRERRTTARLIRAGKVTAEEIQKRNAPINSRVEIVDFWPALRRHTRRF